MYNGSKAALAITSETWRHELQPLGVRTITLVTLAVKTNSFVDKPRYEISENSNYSEIREFIYGLTDGRLQADGITTKEFATQVIRAVEGGATGTVWAGGNASMARFAWWLLPRFLRVSFVSPRIEQRKRLMRLKDMLVQSIIPLGREMAKASQRRKA
jgi:1-acylglycerone phosphate reductase